MMDSINNIAPPPVSEEEASGDFALSSELADSYMVLIENSWRQYEITLLKLPEQYSAKAKQYLWIVSLLLAGKAQIAIKYPNSLYNLYNGEAVQFLIFSLFALSIIFDIFCFALGVRFLNANTIASMPLGSPYNTLQSNYTSSYKMLCAILSEIHNGLNSAQIRLKTAGKNLNTLGWATAMSVALTLFLVIVLPAKDFIEEHSNERQKPYTSTATASHLSGADDSNQGGVANATPEPNAPTSTATSCQPAKTEQVN